MIDEELLLWLRIEDTNLTDFAADRIEELSKERDQHWDSFVHWRKEADDRSEQLAAARQDAKEAEAYAEELEADRKKTYEALLKVSRIHGEVEAKLAKAVWLLTDAAVQLEDGKIKTRRNRAGLIWQFLEEIKGESHE